jgi:hypothetical protein
MFLLILDELTQEFRTQTNIADCLEKARKPKEIILEAFQRAVQLSKGFPSKEIISLKHLAQYHKTLGNQSEAGN